MAKLVKELKNAPYPDRVDLYTRIAALGQDLPDPEPRVTQALAKGLLDPDFYVREHCLTPLLMDQDPGALVKGLLKGLEQLERDWKRINKRIAEIGSNAGRGEKKVAGFGEQDQRDIHASMLYFLSYFGALGQVPDPQIEKALVSFVGRMRNTKTEHFPPACGKCSVLVFRSWYSAAPRLKTPLKATIESNTVSGTLLLLSNNKVPDTVLLVGFGWCGAGRITPREHPFPAADGPQAQI